MAGERAAITAFFRALDGGDFVALPPTRERFEQSEGHEDARRVAAERGIASPNWAFWHHQSAWVFDASGDLTAPLLIHWGGDHDAVAAALSTIPPPFRIVDGGPSGAFQIVSDSLAEREQEPLPEVSDTKAVKERIKRITAQRRTTEQWSEAEIAWLNDVLATGDLAAQGYVVRWIAGSERITRAALDALMGNWRKIYSAAPDDVLVWDLLRTLQRRGDPRLEATIEECIARPGYALRAGVAYFLTERADPADIPRLYRLAVTPSRYVHSPGNSPALRGWLHLRAAQEGRTVAEVAALALGDPGFDEAARRSLTKTVETGR